MTDIKINISDIEKVRVLGMDDITVDSIMNKIDHCGCLTVPLNILTILTDMRCPNNKYGAYSSKKLLLEWSGINSEHKDHINNIISQYERQKGILYMDVFEGLPIKTFDAYTEALNKTIGDDLGALVDKIVYKCHIDKTMASDFINVYMALRTYNGFIMEFMIKQMLQISNRYKVLDKIFLNDGFISSGILDKEYGIDILTVPIDVSDVNIPLQLKSQTHFKVNRRHLEKTFDDHKQYKKLHNGIVERELKGNVYFLHYDMHSLRVALLKNKQFNNALPMSKELEHLVLPNPIFKYVEVWDVLTILDDLVNDIEYNVYEEVSNSCKGVSVCCETNVTTVTFYKE